MTEKKILITGGAGFIGSAVVQELQDHGHEVFVIDDLSFGNRSFIHVSDSHFYQEDIRNNNRMASIIQDIQPQWVIHLAAIHFIPYCNQHPYEAFDINVRGTMQLMDVLAQTPSVEKVFFASTAAVYPIHDVATPETLPPHPLDVYGLSKLTGERLCREFHLSSGIPTVICRFFNAFGPRETNPHLIPEIQKQLLEGKRTIKLGNLEPKRDFIHTSDMAVAVRMLLEQFSKGIDTFNLGQGMEYSVREIVAAFERQLGETITIEQDPNRMRPSDRGHLLSDNQKLKDLTGWRPKIGIDEGIATLVKETVSHA
ncbi:MAG: GDP-mannose 4,6-dehydratase [Bacteroidota bacterium]